MTGFNMKTKYTILGLLLIACSSFMHAGVSRSIVEVGKTPLTELQSVYGGVLSDKGDASTAVTYICYEVTEGDKRKFTLVLSHDKEMGGSVPIVTGVSFYIKKSASFVSCGQLEYTVFKKTGIPDMTDLLGKLEEDVTSLLGKPDRSKHRQLVYSDCSELPLPDTDPTYEYWKSRDDCFEGAPVYFECKNTRLAMGEDGRVIAIEFTSVESIC